jgi:hypothetical protein
VQQSVIRSQVSESCDSGGEKVEFRFTQHVEPKNLATVRYASAHVGSLRWLSQ